jgi:sulfite exporter TauE/SafE
MLSSIHPLGERARGNRWGATATYYVLGAVLGGAAVGGIAGTLGWGLAALAEPSEAALVVAVVGLLIASALLDGLGLAVPSPERQVDETWLARYRSWVYGGGFGIQLGTGVMTFVKTASVYAMWLLVVLGASPLLGAAVGAWFGLVRGAALLTVAGVDDPTTLRSYFRRMAELAPVARGLAVAGPILAAAGVVVAEVVA